MNKKNFFYLLIIVIVCAVIIPVIFIMDEGEESAQIHEKDEKANSPQTEFTEVDFKLYNQAKTVRWELKARTLAHMEKEGTLNLKPVVVSVFDNHTGEKLYQFTATEGEYLSNKERLTVNGPVEINTDNYRLKAGKLTWEQEKDIIAVSGGVEIKTASDCIISGESLLTDSYLRNLAVQGTEKEQAQVYWEEQENEK